MSENLKIKTVQHNFCIGCDSKLSAGGGASDLFGFHAKGNYYCDNKACVRYGLVTALATVKMEETNVI